jgi:hypothetical protein
MLLLLQHVCVWQVCVLHCNHDLFVQASRQLFQVTTCA